MEKLKSIAILIDYFGSWPKWFPVFLASCGSNPTVDWIITTDCEIPENPPNNVKFIPVAYADYVASVSRRLGINFNPSGSYKICDIRPMFGDMYREELADYDYYGFGDLDVIYGDIRRFYTDDVLSFDAISTHPNMLSGHLVLFKNTEEMRKAYLKIPNWRKYLEAPKIKRFDEDVYSYLFIPRYKGLLERCLPSVFGRNYKFDPIYSKNVYFKEQYTTVFHPMPWHDGIIDHPDVWFWKNGVLTNNRNIGREYLYLHLMNFQSMRYANPACRERYTPWKENPHMLFTRAGEESEGVRIDWAGIQRVV